MLGTGAAPDCIGAAFDHIYDEFVELTEINVYESFYVVKLKKIPMDELFDVPPVFYFFQILWYTWVYFNAYCFGFINQHILYISTDIYLFWLPYLY
ncbi:hypothetical protein SAMN04488587_1518 [Methanococcoides vulcani]|uniref:Uncharacterized protein n=1 Tax=Methanococcoides vulcani TaxID=1353158 RepID=A0A1I0A9U9_9EURY|nr:hypothetical protein SAMN04488587_1518 [Methanococcoides vulcani]